MHRVGVRKQHDRRRAPGRPEKCRVQGHAPDPARGSARGWIFARPVARPEGGRGLQRHRRGPQRQEQVSPGVPEQEDDEGGVNNIDGHGQRHELNHGTDLRGPNATEFLFVEIVQADAATEQGRAQGSHQRATFCLLFFGHMNFGLEDARGFFHVSGPSCRSFAKQG